MTALLRDCLALTKPRIVLLVLLTAAAGVFVAPRAVNAVTLACFLLGTASVAGGVNALNQFMEREHDGRMRRTRLRPLPAGRLTPRVAFLFAMTIVIAGIALLWIAVNALTAALAAFTAVTYLLVYTPLKRVSSLCTIVGAIPGAIPPLMGWTAATNAIEPLGLMLFAILFFWQLPHFAAISWIYRDDYRAAGFVMSSGVSATRQAILFAAVLLTATLAPWLAGPAGVVYGCIAICAGIVLIALAIAFNAHRDNRSAWRLFAASNAYLVVVMIALVASI